MKDTIVAEVRTDLRLRSEVGIEKYNTTLDRTDIDLKGWLQHAYEETLDKALYLKRAIRELEQDKVKCKCKIPHPQMKVSENGVSGYCAGCVKPL